MKRFNSLILMLFVIVPLVIKADEFSVPIASASVVATDLDLDGDIDIVIGHNYDYTTEWSGVSFLINDSAGYFILKDTLYLYGGQTDIQTCNFDSNPKPEIIAKYYSVDKDKEYVAILYNADKSNTSFFTLNTNKGVGYFATGDLDNDKDNDILYASNIG